MKVDFWQGGDGWRWHVRAKNGRIVADFAREAESFEEALISAVMDFQSAGAAIERIEPDPLVSLADMARRSGLTRAALTNYASGQRQGDFPAPVAGVPYHVEMPGGSPSRCNPITAPAECTAKAIEDPAFVR